ncbi:MFS transporter [Litorilinea aerophila]|uniref:MFS transporter n=1 Tax=Litorilinea aerophila TaxID=1204385 RepID=A0A540V9H9_9CHLR|nr:MFS transporter [Litorilinea aerophila]MCC9078688.1 MFS transporter [Litorilinea aerophila]GIV79699.1 MAG: MFS transporter [Litorilinea sp.]
MKPTSPANGQSGVAKHDPYAAFRIRNYRLYIIGWFIALVGTRIQSIAIAWEMYQRTGEALSLGLVGLAQALPTMALALPAGFLADKFNRTRLVMLSLAAMTLTSLALAGLSVAQGSIAWMYFFLFLDAAAVMIGRPARTALVPQLVPAEVFPNAVTWNTSMMQIASVLGPALGGVIVAFNVPMAYVITAASSLLFLVMLARLDFRFDTRPVGGASLQTLLAGIQFVWKTRIILTMISLDLFAVLLGGAVYLLPIYAEDILQVGATGFGWLRAAPAIGAFCMAMLMVYLPPMKHAGRALLLNVAGFGVATIIFGISKSFWLSFAMLFLTGAFDNVSMIVRQTLQQLLTPDHMRGRVSAVSSVFVGASNELGGLESGLVAHWFGPVVSVVSGGIGTLLVVAGAALLSPRLRNFGALHDARPEEDGEAAPAKLAASSADD